MSIVQGYHFPTGLHYQGADMGFSYPDFCLCAFWGPHIRLAFRGQDRRKSPTPDAMINI